MNAAAPRYTHGHSEPVLRSHRWRTVDNSAAYLLPHLRDGQRILDVGCGPATITVDLGRRFPSATVLGIDPSRAGLDSAPDLPENVSLRQADIFDGSLPDDHFDVVHAHQVLQHLKDPVEALRQLQRVCRPGGVVAVRDADYGAMTWAPDNPQMTRWQQAYRQVAQDNGGQPDAGRYLLGWAQQAGLQVTSSTASVWCFSTPDDRIWWAELWADRIVQSGSRLRQSLEQAGRSPMSLEDMATGWRGWARASDGWFVVVHGEIIGRA